MDNTSILKQSRSLSNSVSDPSESSTGSMTPLEIVGGMPLAVDSTARLPVDQGEAAFVNSQHDDDVFGRSTSTTPNQNSKAYSTSTAAAAKIQANLATPVSFKQTPRLDRMNSPITPANAQGVLPPEACVFVAK